MQRIQTPEFTGPILWVSSDYVVGNKQSLYDVIAILIADPTASIGWEHNRRMIRERLLSDGRRMAYKSLGDRRRFSALPRFLHASNHIGGVCVSLAINRSIPNMFSSSELYEEYRDRPWIACDWKQLAFQHAFQVAAIVAFFVAGFARTNHELWWCSDEDNAFANTDFSNDTAMFFTKFLAAYGAPRFKAVNIMTTEYDEADRHLEDLASIPDLAAGVTAEFLSTLCSRFEMDRMPSIAIESPPLAPRVDQVVRWFMDQSTRLKKIGIYLDPSASEFGMPRGGVWTPYR